MSNTTGVCANSPDPNWVAQLSSQYGEAAGVLLEHPTSEIRAYEEQSRAFLKALVNLSKDPISSLRFALEIKCPSCNTDILELQRAAAGFERVIFPVIPRSSFAANPGPYIMAVSILGPASAANLISTFGEGASEFSQHELVLLRRIVRCLKTASISIDTLAEGFSLASFRQSIPAVYRMATEYRAALPGLVKAFGAHLVEEEASRRREILQLIERMRSTEEDHLSHLAIGAFPWHAEAEVQEVAEQIIREADHISSTLGSLTLPLARANAHAVVELAKILGDSTKEVLDSVSPGQLSEHGDSLILIARYSGRRTASVVSSLPSFNNLGGDISELFLRHGRHTWGLIVRFGQSIFTAERRYSKEIENIKERFGPGAGAFFAFVPVRLWEKKDFLDIAAWYGPVAGFEYHARAQAFHALETSSFQNVRLANRNYCGIANFRRYATLTKKGYDDSLLRENILNLDPSVGQDRKLHICVCAVADLSDAIARNRNYSGVQAGGSKVILVEADSGLTAIERVERIVREQGRPASVIELNGHSLSSGIAFGYTQRELMNSPDRTVLGAESLKASDIELLIRLGACIDTGGSLVLGGCETAFGGSSADNLATAFKRLNPKVLLHASRSNCRYFGYSVNPASQNVLASYSVPRRKTLVL